MTRKSTLEAEIARLKKSDAAKTWVNPQVQAGLNDRYKMRPYQKEALGRFSLYWKHLRPTGTPVQLLYHMATGSGKTLVMAATILDLYLKGYRRFVFLVNSTNIIEKTRDNFLNVTSPKYLFQPLLLLDGRRIGIREATNFQSADPHGINIMFSTVQALHTQLAQPRENALTASDLSGRPTVLISDEAHHINADTKRKRKLSKSHQNLENASWEQTVERMLHSHEHNVLLEFTATAPLHHPGVAAKYRDKVLMDYPLRKFRDEGYSKEVQVLQSTLPAFERALQAALLSLYRQRRFTEAGLSVKPVVLFKSRTIAASRDFHAEFIRKITSCTEAIHDLRERANTGVMAEAFKAFVDWNMEDEQLALVLKTAFAPERLLAVDSKSDSEEKQLAVNTLEAQSNPWRGVFAVDKLNEGWDVLNLFDIVKLYDVKTSHNKPGKTTMAEAQLIGRGARYCPFQTDDFGPLDRRKFDHTPEHPLRICETLTYHAKRNPAYLEKLGKALTKIGLYDDQQASRNPGKPPVRTRKQPMPHVLPKRCRVAVFDEGDETTNAFSVAKANPRTYPRLILSAEDIGWPVWRKAFRLSHNFRFDRLKVRFPDLRSQREFTSSHVYLGRLRIELTTDLTRETLTPRTKLKTALQVLEAIDPSAVDRS